MKTATAVDHILTMLIMTLNHVFLKLIFMTISLFAFCYHYRHQLIQKMKLPLYIKELLALIQLKCLNKSYMKLIGKKLKRIKALMKLTKNPIIIQLFFSGKKDISKKDLKSPWITTGIKKSSKQKQCLYDFFFFFKSKQL